MQSLQVSDLINTALRNATTPMDIKPLTSVSAIIRGRRQTKKKRKRVGRACIFCQRSHMSCDESRPCRRCVTRGCADQCRDQDPDGKRKRRGRKRKTVLPDDEAASSSDSESEIEHNSSTAANVGHVMDENVNEQYSTRQNSNGAHDVGFEHFGNYNDSNLEPVGQNFSVSAGTIPFLSNTKRMKFHKTDMFSDSEDENLGLNLSGPNDLNSFANSNNNNSNSNCNNHLHGNDSLRHIRSDEDDYISILSHSKPMAVPKGCNQFVGSFGIHLTPSGFHQASPDQSVMIVPHNGDQIAHKQFLYSTFDSPEPYFSGSPLIAGIGSYGSLGGYFNSMSPHVAYKELYEPCNDLDQNL